jgi:hypothetical protein
MTNIFFIIYNVVTEKECLKRLGNGTKIDFKKCLLSICGQWKWNLYFLYWKVNIGMKEVIDGYWL